jgi:Cytochrome P460
MASRIIAVLVPLVCTLALQLGAQQKMTEPRYASDGQMLRPEGYREWIFVGSSLGMGYTEGQAPRNPTFHNIYIQPQAFKQYAATGTFPDKTMLVMEVLTPGTNASINKNGQFADRFIGIEAAVKDEKHFPEKWAYFNFIGENRAPLEKAKAFPKENCWSCHNQHAAVDNVFLQFYPVLRDARKTAKH